LTDASLPRVILKPRHALPFFNRHPWVFSGAVKGVEGDPAPGAEVVLVTDAGEFVARGLYNPNSNIVVRLYAWKERQPLDRSLWSQRIDAALALRRSVFGTDWNERGLRLIYSESDGLSGLVVDWYSGWLVVQFTSLALWQRRDDLLALLTKRLQPEGVWLRTEKSIREAEGLEVADGLLTGREPPRPLFIAEQGVRYGVDLVEGHKTGFYLDQRDNRSAVARYAADARVLDAFCYSGGFGVCAAVCGRAKSVLGLDSSEAALALARANAELNGVADRCRFERADVFAELPRRAKTGERFDVVILDPPKMARSRAGLQRALKAYLRLNQAAIELLGQGGILVSCSCSGHVDRDAFEEVLSLAATEAGRSLQILEARGQATDHPVSIHCLETGYLKCYICRVV